MNQKVRWGILSTAQIGKHKIIPAINQSELGEVVAVASRNLENASAFAKETGIPIAYGSYEELLASDEVDAIYCPLPTGLHKEWCLKSAAAGKPMLCEKPLCVNRADAAEVLKAYEQNDLLISEAYMYRFHPRNLKVKELIDSGAIGDLRIIQTTFNVNIPRTDIRYNRELGGGSILDLGCYCVGIARMLTGQEPEVVQALEHIGEASGVDESMVGCLEFPNKVFSTFSCSMVTPLECSFTVFGTEGILRIARGGMIPWPGESFHIEWEKSDGSKEIIDIEDADHYQLMVEAFNQALLNDEKELIPHKESLANLAVVDRLREVAGAK